MAPILFKRTKAERRPRRIITKDLLFHKPPENDELSPLEMEKKFAVCIKSPEENKTPETVDSMVMTFSDDSSFDSQDEEDLFGCGDGCQFDTHWWEVPTPERNNTTTNRMKETHNMTPFSKLALESTSRRLPLSPLDMNTKIQPVQEHHGINPIKLNMKDKNSSSSSSSRRNHQDSSSSSRKYVAGNRKQPVFSQAIEDFDSTSNNNDLVKSPAEIKADLDVFWRRNTKSSTTTAAAVTRQPYISPFSKSTLARDAQGQHTMPPTYSSSKGKSQSQQWVQFTPVKGFDKRLERTLTTPFSKRANRRGSPLLSPLNCDAFCLTPAAKQEEETPEPKNLFDLSLEEEEGVVEIKIKKKESEDCSTVVSGLTKIVESDDEDARDLDELAIDGLNSFDIWNAKEVEEEGRTDTLTSSCDIWGMVVKEVEEDSFDAGDGLLSNFLHNFMVSTPPRKQQREWCANLEVVNDDTTE